MSATSTQTALFLHDAAEVPTIVGTEHKSVVVRNAGTRWPIDLTIHLNNATAARSWAEAFTMAADLLDGIVQEGA